MEHVGLAADGRRAHRVASAALLADDARVAFGRAVRVPLEPLAGVDDREDLELRGLATDVERVVVGRGPGLVAGVLRMRLAPNRGRQVVVEVGGWTRGHRRTVHHLLDVAEVRHRRGWRGPQPRDVDGLEGKGGEYVLTVLGDRGVVDVLRPVVRRHELRVFAVGDVVDVHRLGVTHDVVAVLTDDEDGAPRRGRYATQRLGGRPSARAPQCGEKAPRSGGGETDDGDPCLRRALG